MKRFLLFLFVLCAAFCTATAQMTLALTGCNSLRAQVEGIADADLRQETAFALERLIAPGTWISVMKSYEPGTVARFKNLSAGVYRAKFVLANHSETKDPVASNTVEVKVCPENPAKEGQVTTITLSPNPADDFVDVFFNAEGEDITVSLYDLTGRKVISAPAADQAHRIALSDLDSGVYFVVLEQHAVQIAREKLIVR